MLKLSKKRIAAVLALALIFSTLALMLLSCSKDGAEGADGSGAVYFTVKFDPNGGSAVAEQKVLQNGLVSVPSETTRENYVFEYWELGGKEWDFTFDKVTSDITLKAKWISADSLFNYEPVEGTGTAIITALKTEIKNIRVPETINGYTVTAIGDKVFSALSSENVTSVSLPKTVSSIGAEAFKDCADITIKIDGELTSVGESAFNGCNKLTSVKLGAGLDRIAAYSFMESGIAKIFIPESVQLIEEDAFNGCASLTVVTMHKLADDAEVAIANGAFRDCTALKTVFFYGTDEQLDSLIERTAHLNEAFVEARIALYSEKEPAVEGDWWYMKDGEPRLW